MVATKFPNCEVMNLLGSSMTGDVAKLVSSPGLQDLRIDYNSFTGQAGLGVRRSRL